MSRFQEYDQYDATGLAELVRKREISPDALLEEALTRTQAVNPELNALIFQYPEEARALIKKGLPDAPFTGVPFLIKDLHLLWKGTTTSYGSAAWANNIATHNSTLTERYLNAGFVPFGKTNSPELGLTGTTEPLQWGATLNPWNLNCSPGGSSGGAAAAVAASILPVAHASDGGGSIRIPAAACGLFGLKPTRARTPAGPDRGEGWAGMSVNHVVSRTVRDSAAILDATEGAAPGDPYAAPAPSRPFLKEVGAPTGRLRIAVNVKRPDGSLPDPEVVHAIEDVAALCEDLGHHVREAAPMLDPQQMSEHQGRIIGANVALTLQQRGEQLGQSLTQNDVEKITWLIAEAARTRDSAAYVESITFMHQTGRLMAGFMETCDVYLTPVLGSPSLPLKTLDMNTDDVARYMKAINDYMPYTALFNMTGQPSMSVPLSWSSDGMPVGSLFSARFGDEATLLRLASQLEEARPWADKRPVFS